MKKTLIICLFSSLFISNALANKILVTIGKSGQVTEQQLEAAMQAAPFATQFPAMDEQDQAYLRGDMLLRLARAEALYQEAISTGKNQQHIFQQEMSNFRTALLAQRYLSSLREQMQIPEQVEQQLSLRFQSNSDALIAARSAYIAQYFNELKASKIKQLKQQTHVKTYFERIDKSPTTDTVLAKGNSLTIKYSDLIPNTNQTKINKTRIIEKVNEWLELTLMAQAAVTHGENIDAQLQDYSHNLATRLLLTEKEQQWINDDSILRDYYQTHPNIAYIPERRQIGQIVLATKSQAETMRTRILAGESLFTLAGEYSIDMYGMQRSGDMGWLKEGSASKVIEAAIKDLQDNEISEAIRTEQGWHLVVIVNRKPAERKSYSAIKDRVRQKFLAEKMTLYIQKVISRYPLKWHIDEHI